MKIKVHLTAFSRRGEKPPVRMVEVPDSPKAGKSLLDLAFHYGQNDFQPQRVRSVSVGDVIEVREGEQFVVAPFGFKRLEGDVTVDSLVGRGVAQDYARS